MLGGEMLKERLCRSFNLAVDKNYVNDIVLGIGV